jgi:DMSO/TMAO reductase YedYZ molybdopterin-dependent catalytic subunit
MSTRLPKVHGIASTGLLILCACAQTGRDADPASRERRSDLPPEVRPKGLTIELTGSGLERPTAFTLEQLRAMPFTRFDNVVMRRRTAASQVTSWRGPALELLLVEARIKPGPMTVMLEATDGYQMTCTREDLETAILALQDGEGRWLTDLDAAGTLRLVPPKLTANYWVQDVCRITVEPDDGP